MSLNVGAMSSSFSGSISISYTEKKAQSESISKDAATQSTEVTDTSTTEAASGSTDTIEIGNSYEVDVDALIEQNNQRMQEFTSKLMSMVTKQGEQSNLSLFGMELNVTKDGEQTNLSVFGMELNVTPQDSLEAAESLKDGGEWSVNAVSDRIMNMAYALSGGDESKLETLKSAVLEGFKQAGFDANDRSTMPEITGQTYDEIMKRFDEWETSGMKMYDTNGKSQAADTTADDSEKKSGLLFDMTI